MTQPNKVKRLSLFSLHVKYTLENSITVLGRTQLYHSSVVSTEAKLLYQIAGSLCVITTHKQKRQECQHHVLSDWDYWILY